MLFRNFIIIAPKVNNVPPPVICRILSSNYLTIHSFSLSLETKTKAEKPEDKKPAIPEPKANVAEAPRPVPLQTEAPTRLPQPATKSATAAPAQIKKKPSMAVDKTRPSHVFVSQIEIARQSSDADSTFLTYTGDLQGAIVALSLGLSITAILLIFVGCRLRNVKRRLRRSRMNSNDADYLINGMYL